MAKAKARSTKDTNITLRVTPEMDRRLRVQAKKSGVSMGEFVRSVLLDAIKADHRINILGEFD